MTPPRPTCVSEDAAGVRIKVRVQPKASRSELVGLQGDALKIRIAAPPVDGAANKGLIQLLAKTCGLAKSRIHITQGLSSRTKTVLLASIRLEDLPPQIRKLALIA